MSLLNRSLSADSGMSANSDAEDCVQSEQHKQDKPHSQMMEPKPLRVQYVWRNIILMALFHIASLYGLYLMVVRAKLATVFFLYALGFMSSMGVQAGAHRLWSHRAYKAKLPLRVILAFLHIMAFQNDIYEWCRDHRVHHKYTETDADPHNAKRGFFFSHVGWLLVRKHPDVKAKGKDIDLSDLMADPVVRFQRKYYKALLVLLYGVIPTFIPYYWWSESVLTSYFACVIFRHCLQLNLTWFVNSATHMWGTRPYDKSIEAREANIRHLLQGEGFHNYHHTYERMCLTETPRFYQIIRPLSTFMNLC